MSKNNGVINIKGKQYKTVALRVQEFRAEFPYYTIQTLIVSQADPVIMRAEILDEDGRLIATGHAEEDRGASTINKTSALENCETSAIGRALAAFGLAGSEYASANEVEGALLAQGAALVREWLGRIDSITSLTKHEEGKDWFTEKLDELVKQQRLTAGQRLQIATAYTEKGKQLEEMQDHNGH